MRKKRFLRFMLIQIFYILAIIWVACRGDGIGLTDNGDPEGATGFSTLIQPIFDTNCIHCHAPGGIGFQQTGGSQNNGLDLTRGKAFGSLVNQPTFEEPQRHPELRVLPGHPDSSYIVQKISSLSPKFGSRMPLDGPPYLTQKEIQLIRDWIETDALNN